MKRQIINYTDHIVVDAEKIILLKIHPDNEVFKLIACLDNAGTCTIGSFDDKEDAKAVFSGLSSYIWNKAGANIYGIVNNDCPYSDKKIKAKARTKSKSKEKELVLA